MMVTALPSRRHARRGAPRAALRHRKHPVVRVLNWLASVVVIIVLGLAILAVAGVVSVHVVTSSSMQPALRVHDLLITRTVPADTAEVGEIATLHHPDGHLVTHRVLANEPDPAGPGRLITMQGDDNAIADPQPYPVHTVDATLARVPMLGGALQALSTPPASYVAIGSLLLVVIASLMPRRPARTRQT